MPEKKHHKILWIQIAMAVVSLLIIASLLLSRDMIIVRTQETLTLYRAKSALRLAIDDQIDDKLEDGTLIRVGNTVFVVLDNQLSPPVETLEIDTLFAAALGKASNGKAVLYLHGKDADAAMHSQGGSLTYDKLIDPDESSIPTYTYSQVNKAAALYLKHVSYVSSADNVSKIKEYLDNSMRYDVPAGCTIEMEAGELTVLDNGTGNFYRTTVGKGPYTFYNITPGVGGEFYVMNGDTVVQRGHLRPTGTVRMIWTDTPGLSNIRDLGGWPCDGGTVRYNLIFRGGMVIDATDTDRETWVRMLGIKHDLFLKTYEESQLLGKEEYRDKSPLGDDVSLFQMDLTAPGSENKQSLEEAKEEMREIINHLFDNAIAGEPTYFHCLAGADRTGMVAMIVEGVLGVPKSDIDRDYELTSFSTLRERSGEIYLSDINILNSYPGSTFRDKCIYYLLDCGITLAKINDFRAAAIDGDPQYLTESMLDISLEGTNLYIPHGDGWIQGGRCSSSGEDRTDVPGYTLTNYISVQKGDIVYIKNMVLSDTLYSGMYKTDKRPISGFYMTPNASKGYVKDLRSTSMWQMFTVDHDDAAYIRLCGSVTNGDENVIINIYRDGKWLIVQD